jgi:thiol:disulfide interchange protein DsbD
LDEGWHTYWLNPGDSGLPNTITWKLPPGFIPGDIQWPYPSKFRTDYIVNFGYEKEVLLITNIQASPSTKPGETITIGADVEWMVCKDECLPGYAELTLSLPVRVEEPTSDPVWKKKFGDTREKLPKSSSDWPVHAIFDNNFVLLNIASPLWFKEEMKDIQFFPEQLELIDYSEPQPFEKTKNGYIIKAKLSTYAQKIPPKLLGVLVSDKSWFRNSDNRAIRIVVPLSQNNQKDIKIKKEVSR